MKSIQEKQPKGLKQIALLVLVALLTLTGAGTAAAQRRERTVDSWRPVHFDVDLSFDENVTQLATVRTKVALEVLAPTVDKVDFDFGDMIVDSVLLADQPAKFERTSETLSVLLPAPAKRGNKLDITINYHGQPKDGLIFAKDRDGNPSATGDNWPNRVHQWIPSLDHPSAKATVTFTIAAPQRYQVVANGKFISLTGNAAVSHWKFDETKAIPAYCMVVAVNQGALINSPFEALPLLYNVPQRDREYAPKGFAPAAPALAFFSQTIAPYPYEKLALIVGATRFGGMENSSAIVFANNLFDSRQTDPNAPAGSNNSISARFGIPTRMEAVVAHEIAHQWFGDSVTESTWADLWLSEGFATYFAGLFIEKYDGEAAFRAYMREAAQRYFNFEKRSSLPIHDTETTNLMSLLNPNNYEKGAWVLHMLRSQLGDEAFFKGLRDYYNAHKEANATTEDLQAALEKSSGKNLKDFFARWIYGRGHPRYQVSYLTMPDQGNLTINVNQLQEGEAFLDAIPIELTIDNKKVPVVIYPKSKQASLTVPLKGKLTATEFDPNDTLLKEVSK
ncbi:MAG TPA: M1 family metallopeptidase [Pyrinomonadaceae bacterium]|nr:M1 family metallopeptidase [Pyrinomonadaceae bacterium]